VAATHEEQSLAIPGLNQAKVPTTYGWIASSSLSGGLPGLRGTLTLVCKGDLSELCAFEVTQECDDGLTAPAV
jgi:hypothetical protein